MKNLISLLSVSGLITLNSFAIIYREDLREIFLKKEDVTKDEKRDVVNVDYVKLNNFILNYLESNNIPFDRKEFYKSRGCPNPFD
ncbi:MAG: hypothetical protein QXI33_01090 [Candidatus Pacearchaeota archaeon]